MPVADGRVRAVVDVGAWDCHGELTTVSGWQSTLSQIAPDRCGYLHVNLITVK